MFIRDPKLLPIWEKVTNGDRLSAEDGMTLFSSPDLLGLGHMANWVKEKKTGSLVSYIINRQINPTNICLLSCRFCDYAKKENDDGAYVLTPEQIVSRLNSELREVHIVSGLYRGWSFNRYLDVVRIIKQAFPHIHIKAYTAVEIDFFARRERTSIRDILQQMKEAGVVSIPGGGAEVFSERVRKALFPFKIGAPKWLKVHETAHELGLRSNATILYGHIETPEERIRHMLRLRDLQDKTRGFLSFIPLAYQPGHTRVVDRRASVLEDLRMIAVSRLLLDNFDHIKAYWVTIGQDVTSLALHFGADDIDGTIGEERIMHAAGAQSPLAMARENLVALIEGAGKKSVERDGLYNMIKEDALKSVPEAVSI